MQQTIQQSKALHCRRALLLAFDCNGTSANADSRNSFVDRRTYFDADDCGNGDSDDHSGNYHNTNDIRTVDDTDDCGNASG